ncbi:MAG TPA: serine/threonine-protein kinase, partial [Nannocystaceae bacterium]|nr:serine/threonine-protein kinase [Nannocystaceae bacterium]
DPELDRVVALKLLWPSRRTPERIAWLRREAHAMARLSHPNVVQVYDVGEVDEQVWIAMELVAGGSLSQWLRTGPSAAAVLDAFAQAARGLQAAHEAGLVHRDVKPGNMLVDASGRVRVGDFGLARLPALDDPTPPEVRPVDRVTPMPEPSDARAKGIGTPAYMAPEQHLGGTVGPAADQYAFAVALWEALFGVRPYADGTAVQLVLAKLEHRPIEPAGMRVPPRVRDACMRALAPEPSGRHASMAALAEALQPRSRRPLWWIGGGSAALAAVAVAALWPAAQTCDGTERELAAIWDDDTRTDVQRAVVGSGLAYADATWATASQALDDYASRWSAARAQNCRAIAAREQGGAKLDQHSACLHQRRTALAAVVDVVRAGEPDAVQHWVAAVGELPPPESCLATDAAAIDVRVPDEAAMRPRVEALRDRLAQATALGHAGATTAAREAIEPALADAQRLGFAPLVAEAWLVRGDLLRGDGDAWQSERALEQAYWSALAVGHDAVTLRAATSLVYVVGYDQAHAERGATWARHAHAALERGEGSSAADAALAMAEGSMLRREARWDEARERFEHARDVWAELGPDDIRHARALASLAGLELAVSRPHEALAAYEQALAIELFALGPDHPALASTHSGIGTANLLAARYPQARAAIERAIVLRERSLGSDHPLLAASLNNLGIVLNRLGEYDEARAAHLRALAIRERVFDADHPDVLESLNNIAVVLLEQARYAEAEPYFVRCIASNEHRLGTEHFNLVGPLDNLGIVLREQGRHAEAEVLHRRALAIASKSLGGDSRSAASARFGLGAALLGLGRADEAARELARAEPTLCGPDGDPSRCGETRFTLARAKAESGAPRREVLALARAAVADFERAGASATPELAAARAWLAARSH